MQEYRIGNKQAKLTKQQNRLKQRLQRLQSPTAPAPSGSSSGSNSNLGTSPDSLSGLSA